MPPFLQALAAQLLQSHGTKLDRVAVVLPSRRAGVHLRRHLAEAVGGPLWSPELFTTTTFQESVGGMRTGEGTTLLLHLLACLRQVAPSGSRELELGELLQWGPVTLHDMGEVDAHMIPLDAFYRDLRAYHEIEAWSFRLDELSQGQERLLRQWKFTGDLHRAFDQRARAMGLGTPGLVARVAAEAGAGSGTDRWDHVYFAGLNAIEPAMARLMEDFITTGKASVAWDHDEGLLKAEGQRAGNLGRANEIRFGPGIIPTGNALQSTARTITVLTLPSAVAQARHAAGIVAALPPAERARTAVVLAREDLLMPLLEALPPDIGPVNVTMEPPLRLLPAHGLVTAYLRMHREAPGQGLVRKGAVVALLQQALLARDTVAKELLERTQRMAGTRLATESLFPEGSDQALRPGFADASRGFEALAHGLHVLISRLLKAWPGDVPVREQLHRIAVALGEFGTLLHAAEEGLHMRTVIDLLERHLRGGRIGLRGEPLSGLQIMGVLETRSIHHPRVLLLSANEGVLPPAEGAQTFIPFDIRRHHRLPLRQASQDLSALHFMQLFAHCEEAVVMHHGDAEGGAGPSPHIAQMQRMLKDAPTRWERAAVKTDHMPRQNASLVQPKGERYRKAMIRMAERGFSPSALGAYLVCPMDFHMRYVLGLEEPEKALDELGRDLLGQAVHEAMQQSLEPWLGKPMPPEAFREAAEQVPALLERNIMALRPEVDLRRGLSHLQFGMAADAAASHLRNQAREAEGHGITILALEKELKGQLHIPGSGTVAFRGRADRIDRYDGVVRVLDLKTGFVDEKVLKLTTLSPEALGRQQRHALQLLTYAWMLLRSDDGIEAVQAGIAPLQRTSRSDAVLLCIGGEALITRAQLPGMEALLAHLVGRIMDMDAPLRHDPESGWCTYCAEA